MKVKQTYNNMANYTNSEILEIAKTINSQLNATTSFFVRGSWGISKRAATLYNEMPTLALRVSGVLHKGWVYIAYDEGRDLYNLYAVSLRGVVKKAVDGVFCDEFGDIIDQMIERSAAMSDAEYRRKAIADSRKKWGC